MSTRLKLEQPLEAAESFSTAEVAGALGVSVSTVKRWVDEGILPAVRTAGGHRRLRGQDVLNAVRGRRLPYRDLSQLGLLVRDPPAGALHRQMVRALRDGDGSRIRELLFAARHRGMSWAALADKVVAPVMAEIGDGWERGRLDITDEHRATVSYQSALHVMKSQLPPAVTSRRRPLALGGGPEGDPYVIANLLAELVLLEGGWEVVNFGPNTPISSLCRAIERHLPRLVWLSASYLPEFTSFHRASSHLARTAKRTRASLMAGGRALTPERRVKCAFLTVGNNLQELAAYAAALHTGR